MPGPEAPSPTPVDEDRAETGAPSGGVTWKRVRAELSWGAGIALIGAAAVGVGWATLIHQVQQWSFDDESVVALDGTLGLLGIAVGVLVGLLLIVVPSRAPAVRTGTGILASVLGAGLAFLIGRSLGAPEPLAYGMALTWPITTSVVIMTRSVIGLLLQNG
jgi:hypothetical protein